MHLPRLALSPRRIVLMAVLAIAAGASAFTTHSSGAVASCGLAAHVVATPRLASERAVLCEVNHERVMRGLHRLRISWSLTRAAKYHSRDMVARSYFSHTTPRNSGLLSRARDSGYLRRARAYALAETIATATGAQTTPAGLVGILMASAPHRMLLLSPAYRDIGIGIVGGSPMAGGGGATLTLDLGRRVLR